MDRVSLCVERGEIFCLVGPNGSGKSTLIRLLACSILPTSGTARINGYDLVKDIDKIRYSIGVVFNNERSLYWRLTVKQNLEYFASLYNMPSGLIRYRTDEFLELLDLKEEKDTWVEALSSGIKQKISIIRGLLHDPDIIFMDEPTRGLDYMATQKIWRFIKEELVLRRKKTVFICTNYLKEAEELGERLAVINKGRVISVVDKRIPSGPLVDTFDALF